MAASSIVLLLSLATVGVRADGAAVGKVVGVVVGCDGHPASGAEVIAAGGMWDGQSPGTIGRTTADGDGRFSLDFSADPSGREIPTLWAFRSGSVAASSPIDRDAIEGHPVRLTLGAPARSSFVVAGPDGQPIVGARVVPRLVSREVPDVPSALADLASATTDGEGRAIVTAFRPEELIGIRIESAGFGVQLREFRSREGQTDNGAKAVTLLAAGKISGRVVAENPKSTVGLVVRVSSSSGGRGGADSGLAEAITDEAGHFVIPAIAAGNVTIRIRPRSGSPDLPARVIRRILEPGKEVGVEMPLRRGVRVTGVARDSRDGHPISGAVVAVVPSGPSEPSRVQTDAEGRFETFVLAGLVTHRVLKVPAPYLGLPAFVGPRPVEVPPAIASFELPPISLTRGVALRGTVVDAEEKPVADARVEASWTMFDGRIRAPRSMTSTSKADGSFVLGPVDPDAELAVVASAGHSGTGDPVRVRASDGRAVELTVVESDAVASTGRVVAADGRPIAGASVRIWSIPRSPADPNVGGSLLTFGGSDSLTTDEEGRFRTPHRLRRDRDYRVLASAQGYHPGRSRPIRPDDPDALTFPDLVLPAEPRRVAVEGRVLDRQGRPVTGAGVRTSADGPCCRRATTNAEGRFVLADVPEGRTFLFVEADGFRFAGRAIDPGRETADLAMTRLGEEPETVMTTRSIVPSGRTLARQVMAPYVERVLSQGDHATRIKTLELLARVDPERVLALIDAGAVEDAGFADHLRHAASCSLADADADERMAVVEAIQDAEWRVLGAFDAVDALPATARVLKREWVDRALRDARSIREPSRRVVAMAGVAARLLDLGDQERAHHLLAEARPLVESLPLATSGGHARIEFAEILARVDPANALALTEDVVDPGAFDRCRLKIARHLAARDPVQAARVLESLRDPRSLARSLPALCYALAPVDPTLARQIIARSRGDDPCSSPYAIGMMALAVSATDKVTATTWLREAFDRLSQLAATGPPTPGAWHEPAAVAAALLPVAERIDPKLVPEFFWRAASFHILHPGGEVRSDAVLALLLARYDRSVALAFFEPAADRALASADADLTPVIAAAAILDPDRAVRMIENLPDAPDLTFHHPKNEARLGLAAALARSGPACWDDATTKLLHLWTAETKTGE